MFVRPRHYHSETDSMKGKTMTTNGVQRLTIRQRSQVKDAFVKPYIQLIVDNLDLDLDHDQDQDQDQDDDDDSDQNKKPDLNTLKVEMQCKLLKQLTDLISRPLHQYTPEALTLVIAEGTQQEDQKLKTSVDQILGSFSLASDSREMIYKTLYRLFHECRLNKSPDPADINARITCALEQYNLPYLLEEHYNDIPKKTDTLITRLRLSTSDPDPSLATLDTEFCVIVGESLNEILQELRNPSAQSKGFMVDSASPIYHPQFLTTVAGSPRTQQRKQQEDADAALALLLQTEIYEEDLEKNEDDLALNDLNHFPRLSNNNNV